MESLIIKCYDSLQEKLEKEKENLKSVEANIKKIIGRSVVDSGRQVRIGQKRNSSFIEPPVINSNAELWKSALEASGPNRKSFGGRTEFSSFDRTERRHRVNDEFVPRDMRGPPNKRKSIATSNFEKPKTVFSRLSGPVREPVEDSTNYFPPARTRHTVSSQIFVPPVEVPSRSEALEEQQKDPNFRARNKRMFGALLGTLRKFKQDETKLKDRESKKARVEAKLEEAAVKERLALRTQRDSLFRARQLKYSEIRTIELRLARLKEHEAWSEAQKPLANFIRTKAEPPVFYLPKVMSKDTRKLLAETKTYITDMIAEKNKEVEQQVEEILRQGIPDQDLDSSLLQHEDEDQELEDAYHLGGKSSEPPPLVEQEEQETHVEEEEAGEGEDPLNSAAPPGVDQFGRDTSRREPADPSTPAPAPPAPGTATAPAPSSGSRRSQRKRSPSPPPSSPREGKRKKAKKSRATEETRIKSEEEEEKRRRKKRKEAGEEKKPDETQQRNSEEADVKPRVTKKSSKKKSKNSSSASSAGSGASTEEEEASDYYYEDSDSYDENKVIKKEREERAVKQEKEEKNGGEASVVKSEKNGDKAAKQRSGDKNNETGDGIEEEVSSSGDKESRQTSARAMTSGSKEGRETSARAMTSGNKESRETSARGGESVAQFPSTMDPVDLNSISLPGE